MKDQRFTRPVWAEVDLDALAHNMREVRKCIRPETLASAVIKADGYGHGAVKIAKTLLENGADRLAVATLSEAVQLRNAYDETEILILGYTPDEGADEVIEKNIIQAIYNIEQAKHFSSRAEALGKTIKIHIKLDTGMRRIGMPPDVETVNRILEISELPHVNVEGIFTHFAVADEEDKTFTHRQAEQFKWVIDELEKKGLNVPIKHVANSATIIDLPEYQFDMVRAGIMLYGLYPSKEVNHETVKLKEAMSLKAQVSHVKVVQPGEGISYGLLYHTASAEKIATLPLGYADGFTRLYTGKAKGIVKGEIRPVVGRICMDQCMINVTGLKVEQGDEVTLFGRAGENFISINDYADMIATINYEVVCMISKRVLRVYKEGGKIVEIVDYLR